MLMVKLIVALVSTPPLRVPPLSCATTVMTALPKVLSAGVKDRLPDGSSDGCTANRTGLLLLRMMKFSSWPVSFGAPGPMLVAHAAVYAPESSRGLTTGPGVKVGGWLTRRTV